MEDEKKSNVLMFPWFSILSLLYITGTHFVQTQSPVEIKQNINFTIYPEYDQ